MARDYGRVKTRFWESPGMKGCSPEAKLVALYLLTCEHSNAIGLFRCTLAYMIDDLNLSREATETAIAELRTIGFMQWCERPGWLWILNYLKHNPPENANVWRKCFYELRAAPAECLQAVDGVAAELRSIAQEPRMQVKGGIGLNELNNLRPFINPRDTMTEGVANHGEPTSFSFSTSFSTSTSITSAEPSVAENASLNSLNNNDAASHQSKNHKQAAPKTKIQKPTQTKEPIQPKILAPDRRAPPAPKITYAKTRTPGKIPDHTEMQNTADLCIPRAGEGEKNSELSFGKCEGEDPPNEHISASTPPAGPSPVPVAARPGDVSPSPVHSIPANDGGEVTIPENMVNEFRKAYPAVDVDAELRAMRVWSLANPANRKTRGGMMRFVNGWLEREQNRAPRLPAADLGSHRQRSPAASPEAIRKERLEWLALWGQDGRWPRNLSANGVWRDAAGIGAPPDDTRTEVTAADLASVPAARRRLDAIRGPPS